MPTVEQFAEAQSHRVASELVSSGVHVEQTVNRTVFMFEAGVQVTITIAKYVPFKVGPGHDEWLAAFAARQDQEKRDRERLAQILADAEKSSVAIPKCPLDTTNLREIERNILEAAPGVDGRPVTAKRLAVLAGYKCSSYFREAIKGLVNAGLLVRITGGVRRAR